MNRVVFALLAIFPACTYVTIVQSDGGEDAGAGDAALDGQMSKDVAVDNAVVDAGADVADATDDHIYCWHIAANSSTWPNGPYLSQAPIPCGADAGGLDWGAGQVNQSPGFSCHVLKCPHDDTTIGGMACTWGGYGSICCPELHDGGCN